MLQTTQLTSLRLFRSQGINASDDKLVRLLFSPFPSPPLVRAAHLER